jgi:hypothetical protein
MADVTLPEIRDRLNADAALAGLLVSEAAEALNPTDPRHASVMQAASQLADRLATRHDELSEAVALVATTLALARAGLLP